MNGIMHLLLISYTLIELLKVLSHCAEEFTGFSISILSLHLML